MGSWKQLVRTTDSHSRRRWLRQETGRIWDSCYQMKHRCQLPRRFGMDAELCGSVRCWPTQLQRYCATLFECNFLRSERLGIVSLRPQAVQAIWSPASADLTVKRCPQSQGIRCARSTVMSARTVKRFQTFSTKMNGPNENARIIKSRIMGGTVFGPTFPIQMSAQIEIARI